MAIPSLQYRKDLVVMVAWNEATPAVFTNWCGATSISLTVTTVTDQDFGVSLIPTTRKSTTLGEKGVGGQVNLETDILAKYVERMLAARLSQTAAAGGPRRTQVENAGLTAEFLAKNGF